MKKQLQFLEPWKKSDSELSKKFRRNAQVGMLRYYSLLFGH